MTLQASSVPEVTSRRLVFVGGKGGVGKTVISQAISHCYAEAGKRTLWVTFEDPTRPMGHFKQINRSLWHLNCESTAAFEEYAALKIGVPRLTHLFVQNKLMRYLAKAAPGIHELVLLGKVWYEREHYDHVVVDMPSTGHGLAMFQSTDNFAKLFGGGPVHQDAKAMLKTFNDPKETGHLIVALPEEMPLVESLELSDYLKELFPANPAAFLLNRRFPRVPAGDVSPKPGDWESPLAHSALDYARKRTLLEAYNLKTWEDKSIPYSSVLLVPPPTEIGDESGVLTSVVEQLRKEKLA